MADILITGGAGFIGSHLAERLVRDGHKVTVYDNFSTGKRENIASFMNRIKTVEGDIRDYELLKQSLVNTEYVYHLAAVSSVQASIESPAATEEINVGGTVNVLEAARYRGVKRVIYASSAAVYGESPELPKVETMMPEPLSPYAVHKLSGEHYMRIYHRLHGLETVCLRYFNVFGPRQNPASHYSGVISIFADKMSKGLGPTIFGDGEQTRDFVYIDNVVEANLLAAFSGNVGKGEVLNIATGTQTSLNRLIAVLNEVIGSRINVVYKEARQGDIVHSVANISTAGRLLGYQPIVGLQEGLKQLVTVKV